MSNEAFDEEYYALYQRVEAIMSYHGTNDPYGQGDYTLEPYISESRGLGVSITNDAIVTAILLQELQSAVSQHAPQWEIYLGSGNYDFDLFIGPDCIWMNRNTPELLPQLSALVIDVS
ncbi:MAG TPA: hypothetical protein VGE29_12220 [Prosthecobacter sp.]